MVEKIILGTIYAGVSEDFQHGIYPIARTLKANKYDLSVVYREVEKSDMSEKRLGNLYGFTGGNFSHNVYDTDYDCPTLNTMQGGGKQPMVIESSIVAMRGRNPNNPNDRTAGGPTEQRLEINAQGTSNCLTSVQKDNMVLESAVLTPKRTEYGKSIRKDYENGTVKESRHNMTQLEPRTDGVSNTLTTVQKDNMLLTKEINKVGQISSDGSQYGTVVSEDGLSATLTAGTHGYANNCIQTQYRIRKLTPRECWRLMGFSDSDFEKAWKVNSSTQLYKQAGNSMVRAVLMAIMSQLNIKGVKPWNELNDEERERL